MNGPADHARGWMQKADSDLADEVRERTPEALPPEARP